jgi:hypothetical protein
LPLFLDLIGDSVIPEGLTPNLFRLLGGKQIILLKELLGVQRYG